MPRFDYAATAELYPSRRYAKSPTNQYRRFSSAAEAIRFIIEEVPSTWLAGSYLEVRGRRFEGEAIRALYDAADYPLARQTAAA
jgi:hypothetical protein